MFLKHISNKMTLQLVYQHLLISKFTLFVVVLCICGRIVMSAQKCEPVTIPLCTGLKYNMTVFPNRLNHKTQDEARLEVDNSSPLTPLVKVRCSPDIALFFCLMYAPICSPLGKPLPPCRRLCESAKAGCVELLHRFHYKWPESFACEKLPKSGGDELCVRRNTIESVEPTQRSYSSNVTKMNEGNNVRQKFRCEAMASPMCRRLNYNTTSLPNLFNQDNQSEAYEIQIYKPLIRKNCSRYLLQFLCSIFFPRCVKNIKMSIPPCRSFCEIAKSPGCTRVLQEFGLPWPKKVFDCKKLPGRSSNKMCIEKSGKVIAAANQPDQLSRKKKKEKRRKNKKGRKNRKRKLNKQRRPKKMRKKACEKLPKFGGNELCVGENTTATPLSYNYTSNVTKKNKGNKIGQKSRCELFKIFIAFFVLDILCTLW